MPDPATLTVDPCTWQVQPAAAALVKELLDGFLDQLPFVRSLQQRLLGETGTRLFDWVDRFELRQTHELEARLGQCGFSLSQEDGWWTHAGGMFPAIRLGNGPTADLFLKVESVVDFVFAQRLTGITIEGDPDAAIRRACVAEQTGWRCFVLEQHGERGGEARRVTDAELRAILRHREAFYLRQRSFNEPAAGFDHALTLIETAKRDLPTSRVCDLFFAAERCYWQSRNRAARVQKSRQDALGLGWANHDHHTYRSSRVHFHRLIAVLESLGFRCRERFYAGREAGWGAQVLEQPQANVVVFADVDLAPDEVTGDFAHQPLPPRDELGTVGLWCALHGEAFLEAGMHHLECQFDFEAARRQLRDYGVETMKPFTDFPYLRQAFTQGEVWPVAEDRLTTLQEKGSITPEQVAQFRASGALGSHLEILQRDEGYKGFNQTGINDVIRATDPRLRG